MKALKYNASGWLFLLFFISLYFENWKVPLFSSFLLTSKLQALFVLWTLLHCLFKSKQLYTRKLDYVRLLSFFFIYFLLINVISALIFGGEILNMALLSNYLTLLCSLNVFTSQCALKRTVAVVNIVVMDLVFLFTLNGIGLDFTSDFIQGEDRLRIFGMNPNGLSVYAVLSASCCIYIFFNANKKLMKLLMIGSFICCIELVIMCGSKGGLIYMFVCMFVMLGDKVRKSRKYKLLVLPVAIAFMCYLFDYIMSTEIFVARFTEEDISDGRFALFDRGLKVFLQSPLFGVGMSGYEYYMMLFFGQIRPTHNGYLDVAAYTGLIGFFSLLVYILRQGLKLLKFRYVEVGNVLLVVYLIFVLNFAKDGGVVFSKFTWIHVAIMISYSSQFIITPTCYFAKSILKNSIPENIIKKTDGI